MPATPPWSSVTNQILFHDCMCYGAASFFCAEGLWLWLVQSRDSSTHLLSCFSLSKGAVGGDLQSEELGRRGQQCLRIWGEVSQVLGRAAILQLECEPGRCWAEPFNSALLWSVVAVISFLSCSNVDLSVTDRDYVLSPAGNSESLGGLFCLCLGSFLCIWIGLPSWSAGLVYPPPFKGLPFHALLSSAVPTVLCAPAVCAHKSLLLFNLQGSWLLPPENAAARMQNCVCAAL